MDCARKHGRYGHRDATMILVAYRHGLRASEVCDLKWQQIELSEGRLHVHRVKNGISSVHPIRGDEMRALRKLRRDYPQDVYVSNAAGRSVLLVSTASSSGSGRPSDLCRGKGPGASILIAIAMRSMQPPHRPCAAARFPHRPLVGLQRRAAPRRPQSPTPQAPKKPREKKEIQEEEGDQAHV
jgi:integrase